VNWEGEGYVAIQGKAVSHVDPAKAKGLIESAREDGFWSLCGEYSRSETDDPDYFTTVRIHGESKTVSNYANAAPAWVGDLENRIDLLADTHRWRHGDPAGELLDPRVMSSEIYLAKPGVTGLMRAAARNQSLEVRWLIMAGAGPIDAEDSSGWTALMYAAGGGSMETSSILLAAHADVNHRSKARQTALFAAVSRWEDESAMLKLLVKAGADVNAQDRQGESVLMIAARSVSVPEIAALIGMGADKRLKNRDGKGALDFLEIGKQMTDQPDDSVKARALLADR